MDNATRTFERHRSRLQGIAHRMLGSAAEAEQIVQDAWLRWREADQATLNKARAWLVTITTRLCLDRLRELKDKREQLVGMRQLEPVVFESPATPKQILERAGDVSVASITSLERLAPQARAAFLLREVFGVDYDELADATGKSEAECRQMVHVAKTQLRDERPRYAVLSDIHYRLLSSFAEALARGDLPALESMLADNAELIGDGSGKLPNCGKPLLGGRRIAQLLFADSRRLGSALRIEPAVINGQWGLLSLIDGALESAQTYETDGEHIVRIHVRRNLTSWCAWPRLRGAADVARVTKRAPQPVLRVKGNARDLQLSLLAKK